jgi:hypothetical protein
MKWSRRIVRRASAEARRVRIVAEAAARLVILPLVVRRPLPALLRALDRGARRETGVDVREGARIARIVAGVARLRIFDLPVFPPLCLRRSLVLYSALSRRGYPVSIHFGVQRNGRTVDGHSWVSLGGRPLGEAEPEREYRTILSHPAAPDRSEPRGFEPRLA